MHPTGIDLHTAARRRAMNEFDGWAAEYQHTGAVDRPSSAEARNLFPRYLAQSAILECLERLEPSAVPDPPFGRDYLIPLVLAAENDSTRHLQGDVERRAIYEEREAFAAYLRDVSDHAIGDVDPLPYRRVLEGAEAEDVWGRIKRGWGIDRWYWFPLAETAHADVGAFQAPHFERAGMPEVVRSALAGRGIERVWQIREYGPSYALGIDALDLIYDGAEAFWSSSELDWVVYASHEASITVGGDWLLETVKTAWPTASEHRWTTAFF
jgi:hypothetical protein